MHESLYIFVFDTTLKNLLLINVFYMYINLCLFLIFFDMKFYLYLTLSSLNIPVMLIKTAAIPFKTFLLQLSKTYEMKL